MNANNTISGHVPQPKREALNSPSFIRPRFNTIEEPTELSERSLNHYKPHFTCHSDIASGVMEKVSEPIKLVEVLAIVNQRKIVILRLKELQARIGLGRSAIYYLMDPKSPHYSPNFPRSVKISAHCVGWIEYEIEEFLQSRVSASRS